MSQIKGIEINLNRMVAGRFEKEQKLAATSMKSAVNSNGEPSKLLGPAVLDTSVNKNKFKSPFG